MSPETTPGVRKRPDQAEIESRLTDLHYAIFGGLPDEGRTLAHHPQVVTVKYLTAEINAALPEGEPRYATNQIGAELRALKTFGFVNVVLALGGRVLGWQRKARARELYEARQRELSANETRGVLRRVGGEG